MQSLKMIIEFIVLGKDINVYLVILHEINDIVLYYTMSFLIYISY